MLQAIYQIYKFIVVIGILFFCHYASSNELAKALDLNALLIKDSQSQTVSLLHANRMSTLGMDNNTLELRAADLGSLTPQDTIQRQLNYHWLMSHTQETKNYFGKSAISKILQQRMQYFWQGMKEEKFQFNPLVPDSNGQAKISAYTEYKLSVSEDDIEFALTYRY